MKASNLLIYRNYHFEECSLNGYSGPSHCFTRIRYLKNSIYPVPGNARLIWILNYIHYTVKLM